VKGLTSGAPQQGPENILIEPDSSTEETDYASLYDVKDLVSVYLVSDVSRSHADIRYDDKLYFLFLFLE